MHGLGLRKIVSVVGIGVGGLSDCAVVGRAIETRAPDLRGEDCLHGRATHGCPMN